MKIFEKQLLVSDFDGTLVNSRQQISRENLEAIRFFTQNGGLFCGATGRTPYNLTPYLEGLPFNCPWILFNGACLYDFRTHTVKRVVCLSQNPIKSIIKKIVSIFPSICVHLYTSDRLYLINPGGVEDKTMTNENQSYQYEEMEAIQEPWVKFILHEENAVLQKAFAVIQKEDRNRNYHVFFSIGTYLEITHSQVSKGFALELLKKELGNRVSRIIAIGDYLNDVEMLEKADIKAAPQNAHPKVKSIAQHITAHHDCHAVADLISLLTYPTPISK